MTKGSAWFVAALLTPVWLSVSASQQKTSNAGLTGTVRSDEGRPVDRATVSILGTDKPGVRATETNALGEFSIDGLPAGSFAVWVTKAGFLPSYYGSKDPGRAPSPVAV